MRINYLFFFSQYPCLTKPRYENCAFRMKAILDSQGVWQIVDKRFVVPENEDSVNANEKEALKKKLKIGQCALTIIHQELDDDMYD